METVEVVVRIPKQDFDFIKDKFADGDMIDETDLLETACFAIANGTVLPKNHGKIVDLGKIDKDRIEQDNPVMTINIYGTEIEAVSLDYLYNLPDLISKEETK